MTETGGLNSTTIARGEDIYTANSKKWQKAHLGKVIAIDVELEDLAGSGDDLDGAYRRISKLAQPDKKFYFRRVGPHPATASLPWVSVMLIPLEKYDMRKGEIKLIGPRKTKDYKAYIDPQATKTVVAESVANELGLPCVGYTIVLKSASEESAKLFWGTLDFYGEQIHILVLGENLPDRVPIKVMVGSDIV